MFLQMDISQSIRPKEVLRHATTWMDLEEILQHSRNQARKISFVGNTQRGRNSQT